MTNSDNGKTANNPKKESESEKSDNDKDEEAEETNLEDEEEEEDSGNEEDEDFLSEELNLPETEEEEEEEEDDEDLESESVLDYPVIMDDSEEDRIFKRQLSYPPIPMYHPPHANNRQHVQNGKYNPREKIGMLTPMEEVTEPPSSAATSIDGERRSRSRGRRAGSRSKSLHPHCRTISPFQPPDISPMAEQKSILKSRESLQDAQISRRVTFEGGQTTSATPSQSGDQYVQRHRSCSPTGSVTSEYSSMVETGRRPRSYGNQCASKNEIQDETIVEEAEETEDDNGKQQNSPKSSNGNSNNELEMMSDMEQKEKVIQWQMENAKQEKDQNSTLDTEFPSIVNGIIAELHNLDELIGSQHLVGGVMEMNASKQDHLANVSTQLATYLAQVSPQTILSNLPQVIPLVTSLLYLTGSNFRSQLASLTAVNVFIERLRDCKTYSGLRALPNADLTWLVRALCEISSDSSRSVLKNEGVLALARLIKAAGPEMVFNPILFILMGNDEKIRKRRKEDDDDDRIVIPVGGPGGAPKLKAIALDSLTFALLTFPRDDFNLDLVAKLACHCLLHPKRRMRQAALECLSVVSHAMGSHVALPIFRQVIMEKQEEMRQEAAAKEGSGSISSDASETLSSDPDAENTPPKSQIPSRIPIPKSRIPEKPDLTKNLTPKTLKPDGNPVSAVSARISRHLLPTPSLNDLVEYAVRIPASCKLLSRQNLAVSKQEKKNGSGGEESGESGGSANGNGRRVPSSGASSVTNVEIELEPVLNAIGSGRGSKAKINEVAGSVMAADVAWILGGSGPIKACDGTSVLAPIYKLPEKQLISDANFTTTHIRQLGMVSLSEAESDSSEMFRPEYSKLRRTNNHPSPDRSNPNGSMELSPSPQNFSNDQPADRGPAVQDPTMSRYGYYGNVNGSVGRGMGMSASASMDNSNTGGRSRMSANGTYSLLPNKYSLMANGGMGGGGRAGGGGNMHGVAGDPMISPHHIPGTYDMSPSPYGTNGLDHMDSYGYGGTGAADPYGDPPSMRAPSRAKMSPVHMIRPKSYYDTPRGKLGYSDDDDEDIGINNPSEQSSPGSSEDEEEIMAKQDALRRASQISTKSQGSLKGGGGMKNGKKGKPPKLSPKKAGVKGDDKVEDIVNRMQHEYQVYRVDRVELDPGAPSPEEIAAAAKKKRGELDSAGSNSRDSGVSIGLGSVGSVHTPPGDDKQQSEDQPTPSQSVSVEDPQDDGANTNTSEENSASAPAPAPVPSTTNTGSGGKKETTERTAKRKSALKSSKKKNGSPTKLKVSTVHHIDHRGIIDIDDGLLSRNWKSTPDVASIADDYEPRMPNYRRMSTEHSALGGLAGGHDIISTSSAYHSTLALNTAVSGIGGAADNYMMLHNSKPAAARRRSLVSGPTIDIENRQLQEIQQQHHQVVQQPQEGRSSRLEYHNHNLNHNHLQQQPNHNHNQQSLNYHNYHHPNHPEFQAGYGSMHSIPTAGLGQIGRSHLAPEADNFHRVSSMLDMDKGLPSRESSAGSGNTYSLLHHDSPQMRNSKSTGNLLGGGMDDPYRTAPGGMGMGGRGGMGASSGVGGMGNSYYEIMDHPGGSPARRMLHSRMVNHNNPMIDLGNSTDDMEFPMTPQSESSSNTLPKQSRGLIMGGINSKIVPKKIYKGSFREVNARSKAERMGAITAELFPLDLKPLSSPKHALPAALLQVQASDWETNVDGFRQLVRLARHHPQFLRSDLHNVNMNALRHVMNLRSQVCRAAILFFRELFINLGKAMEHDSEKIAEKLLDKAADTNKFIREDSGKALEALVLNVSPTKALTCLDLYGTRHRNPAVRSMTARMTTKLIDKLGGDRSLTEFPERLLPMLCRFLQEGSLDTRMSAKLAFSVLMESSSFDAQLKRHVPADTLRHVQKAMKAITTKS